MDRFDGKPTYQCMVDGCNNDRDTGSTQHLCRPCYDVITTGNIERYYETHHGSTWIGQIISWNHNLRQEVKDLEYNQEHAYFHEDGNTMSLNDLRNFYVENRDLRAVSHKQCGELVTHQFMVKGLKFENEDLKKDQKYKEHIIDSLRKEMDALNHKIYENVQLKEGHKRKDEYIDSLKKEIEALNYNMDHAHEDDGKFLTVDDLCIFYDENHDAKKHIEYLSDKITDLRNEIHDMEAKLAEKAIFATNTKDQFAERAKINEEKQSVKFVGYTEGFWKGFDMGYEKAKEQFDE